MKYPKRHDGRTKTRAWRNWVCMKMRCTYPSHKDYWRYGGRGITISESWKDFKNFFRDMGECPEGFQIDRIDGTKGYKKGNCRWVSCKQNQQNRCNNIWIDFRGDRKVLEDWIKIIGKELGMHPYSVSKRVTRFKWSYEKAFTTPKLRGRQVKK